MLPCDIFIAMTEQDEVNSRSRKENGSQRNHCPRENLNTLMLILKKIFLGFSLMNPELPSCSLYCQYY